MKEKRDFNEYWKLLINQLSTTQTIRNWTTKSGYRGEDFTAIYVYKPRISEGGYIEIKGPSMKYNRKVKKHSFLKIYPHWNGYVNGDVQYQFLSHKNVNRNATLHAKYIISILHQFEELMYK
jgi:hypothetical protein